MRGPLRVAFINSTTRWGGVKTWTLDFGGALRDRGHRITAVVRRGTPFEDACRERGFTVWAMRFGPKYNPVAVLRVARALRRERAQLAVVNIAKDLNVGALAARVCRLPVVHRVGLVEDFKGSFEERLHHRLLVDRIVVPSEYLRRTLLDRFPWMRPGVVAVVPNSKALARYPVHSRPARGNFVFGVTSQLSLSKGHSFLLQALRILRDREYPVRLRIAGAGSLEASLRAEAASLGLAGAVEFCGFQTDIPSFLATLDAYVLPSERESFSNAVLEAMCAGLPIVAFHQGGVPEVVGEAALLTPVNEVGPLAAAMERLARDAPLRERLGREARSRAERAFDLERNVARLEDLLWEVAGR